MIILAACLLVGCDDTLSAAPFVPDRTFRAALPSSVRHTLDVVDASEGVPAAVPTDTDSWPDLLDISLDVAGDLNGLTLACLDLVESTTTTEPTYRSAQSREWGPIDGPNNMTYNVEVERGTDTYQWDLRAAPSSATDLPSVCTGTHLAGPVALADGTGQLNIWLEAWTNLDGVVGSLSTQYDLTDGQEFRIEIDGLGGPEQRAEDGRYYFRHRSGGGGDFQYRTTILLDDQYDGVLEVRTRWQSDRSGRSDAVVYVDALGASFRFSQCFTRSDRFAWRFTDYNAGFEAGNERLCVYDTPASIDEI